MQVSLHRRVARGLNWGTEYMWSHAINDGNLGGGEGAQPQIAICRACDRGNSAQDIRHTITSNWIYQLPFGPGRTYLNSGVASKILGGWETSGIWTARTGPYADGRRSRAARERGPGRQHLGTAAEHRSGRIDLPGGRTDVRASGSTRLRSPFRRTGRGAMPAARSRAGPGLVQVDFALQKKNRFAETQGDGLPHRGVQHVQPHAGGQPRHDLTSPASFGLVTTGLNRTIGTGTSRQLQLALRLNF